MVVRLFVVLCVAGVLWTSLRLPTDLLGHPDRAQGGVRVGVVRSHAYLLSRTKEI